MRVRKVGSGPLGYSGGVIHGGEEADVPADLARRYGHKLVILDDLPTPTPVVTETTPAPKSKQKPRRAARKRSA